MRDFSIDSPAKSRDEDQFNRWPFCRRLAQTIAEFDATEGAPVIGVFGRWGYGKSTVLNFICEELRREYGEHVDIFSFNPWLFKDTEALVKEFLSGVAASLDRSLVNTGQRIGELLQISGGLLGLIPIAGSTASKLAERVGDHLTRQSVDEQLHKICEITRNSSKKVVVVIDDLDRLDRDEILLLLKLVRLSANFPQVVYLLAFDDEMVARVAGERYGGSVDAGRQFLEKIVQYAFTLPAVGHHRLLEFIERRTSEACDKAGMTVDQQDWQRFRNLAETCFIRRLSTPRQAIRYGNALNFALPMLKGEVDTYHQILVEGLRMLFPELYNLVRDNSIVFLGERRQNRSGSSDDHEDRREEKLPINRARISEIAADVMEDAEPAEQEAGANLLCELFTTPAREKGITIDRYFDRYFSYSVAPDDIGDTELDEVVELAENSNEEGFHKKLSELAERSVPALIEGLHDTLRRRGWSLAERLVGALARNGAVVAARWDLVDDQLSKRLGNLIAELVKNWPCETAKRYNLSEQVLRVVEPLPLGLLILNSLPDNTQEDRELRYYFWHRIEEASESSPIYLPFGRADTRELLNFWSRYDPHAVRRHFETCLTRCPEDLFKIIFPVRLCRYNSQ